jgi:hypothetical protein
MYTDYQIITKVRLPPPSSPSSFPLPLPSSRLPLQKARADHPPPALTRLRSLADKHPSLQTLSIRRQASVFRFRGLQGYIGEGEYEGYDSAVAGQGTSAPFPLSLLLAHSGDPVLLRRTAFDRFRFDVRAGIHKPLQRRSHREAARSTAAVPRDRCRASVVTDGVESAQCVFAG